LLVRVDPTQIEQVIINLVTNARDAMASGGVVSIATSTVDLAETTDALQEGSYAVLTVTDTGSGMDSETRQLIFDPFFTTKDVGKGTGLGLATVYGIVQQSHGDIRVVSEVNRGSSFRIYLPPAGAATLMGESEGRKREVARVGSVPPPNNGAVTVLLVEDEPTVRNVVRRILKREGFRVLTADSAERALAVSAEQSHAIDLLVTDVVMSGMGGPQLAEQLRALRPNIRTLLMSGYSRNQVIPHDDPAGGAMFLAKPFTNDSLVAKVTELLFAAGRSAHTPAA
jgi:CheY-like chemotaxis protein